MLLGYFEQIKALISDPTSNLTAAAMGVSIIVIFIVLIALLLLFFALSSGQKPDTSRVRSAKQRRPSAPAKPPTPEQLERRRRRRRLARRVWWTTILGGLVISWVALYAGTSVNLYCGNTCHAMVGPSDQWKKSPHRQVSCVRCHEGGAASSFLTGSVSRAKSVYYQLADATPARAAMPSRRCLECHGDIVRRTIVTDRAIAMSHKEPVAAGSVCADCHGAQGHVKETLSAGMSTCLPCHDGQRASADCVTCHPKGIEAGLKLTYEQFGDPVKLPEKPTCGGCHSQEKCDACHGLRMPHPEDFEQPKQHARLAAFESKNTLCFRCHTPGYCLRCHRDFNAHGAPWKRLHMTYDTSHGNGYCLWCHRTQNFCTVCH